MTLPVDVIRGGVAELLEDIADANPALLTDATLLWSELGLDSVSMVEFLCAAEERFDVRIPSRDPATIRTVGDAVRCIEGAQLLWGPELSHPDAPGIDPSYWTC
jgi:acyl carrier protein